MLVEVCIEKKEVGVSGIIKISENAQIEHAHLKNLVYHQILTKPSKSVP